MTKKIEKPFKYDELLAMCLLCAGEAGLMIAQIQNEDKKNYKKGDEVKLRKNLEDKICKIIDMRWNDPNKN